MKVDTDALKVRNNEAQNRFEIEVDGQLALLEYYRQERKITYTHTEVPDALEGKGIGSKLARHALEFAREHDLNVNPLCPFVKAYVRRHPEYQSLTLDQKE